MIWFIRHGESEANLKGVFAGQKDDSSLTELGKDQALKAAEDVLLQNIKVDKIVISHLIRAMQTAEIVAQEIGFPVEKILYDDRITEYDMGELTGTPIRKVTSEELISSKNAENVDEFRKRVLSFFDEYKDSEEVILLVSHAGVGRMIHAIASDTPATEFYNLDPFRNGSVNKIT